MKLDDFRKAEGLVNKISSIEKLIKEYKLGRVSENTSFTDNNDDFYNARFLNVSETREFHDTGGGNSELCRITITEFKDGSGARYELSKQETIILQEFLKDMLKGRLNSMNTALDSI